MTGSARGTIGQVLEELRKDFPDISPSKIRFLEAEGLIEPERSASGYRRFTAADVDRLRYILTAQRDEYLPLRVIKERLTARDRAAPGGVTAGAPAPPPVFTRSELLEAGGCPEGVLAELEDYGLIRRRRQYGPGDLAVARAAMALSEFGVQPRHLRAVKAAVERETSLVEQVTAPIARQRDGREPALRTAVRVATLIEELHATLVTAALTDAGLAGPAATASRQESQRSLPGRYTERGLRSASGR
jgi:DNA-binding transcriptional MerR regulator